MSYPEHQRGNVYRAAFSATAISAAVHDVFCVTAPSNSRVVIREIIISPYSDAGDAESELLGVTLLAGSTGTSGGSEVTSYNVKRHTGASTAGTEVLGPSATEASTTSAELILADALNVTAGTWVHRPDITERIVLEPSETLAVKITAPADALTANGTIVFEEIGKT